MAFTEEQKKKTIIFCDRTLIEGSTALCIVTILVLQLVLLLSHLEHSYFPPEKPISYIGPCKQEGQL